MIQMNALVQNPWDHDDAERLPRAREGDWLAGSLGSPVRRTRASLQGGRRVGMPVIGADGAVDLPERPRHR